MTRQGLTSSGCTLALLWMFARIGCNAGAPIDPGPDDPDGPPGTVETAVKVFDNFNVNVLHNTPTSPTDFVLQDECKITGITTVHWNDGAGTDHPGTIALQAEEGTTYGPWPASGSDGQGGTANVYWECTPNVSIPPGRYIVVDSDPSTWSQNSASDGRGMCSVEGVITEFAADILVRGTAQPSDEDQTFRWQDAVSVTVPGGLLQTEQSLTIKRVSAPPPSDDPALNEIAVIYDIALGDMHELAEPVEVQMVYDPVQVQEFGPPGDVLSAAYWDPAQEIWVHVPARVAEDSNVLIMEVDHLSRLAGRRRVTPGYIRNDFFGLSYVRSVVNAETGPAAGWYMQPEPAVTGRSPDIPDYVEDVWYFVNKHRETYEDATNAAGLKFRPLLSVQDEPDLERLPLPIDVSGSGNPYRSKITGDIRISLDCAGGPELLSPLIAHELFHAVQSRYYTCAGMTLRKWWIESTAEYASHRIAVPNAAGMGGKIALRYLERPLDWSSGLLTPAADPHVDHEYTTAHFLDFLVSVKGVDFIEMWTETSKSWSTNMLGVLAGYLDGELPKYYQEFAEFWIFGATSPVHDRLMSQGFVQAAFIDGGNWTPSVGGFSKNILLERYSSALLRAVVDTSRDDAWALTVGPDTKRQETFPDGVSVVVYRFPGDAYDRSVRIGVLDCNTPEIPFEAFKDDVLYLLVINATSSTQTMATIVKASDTRTFNVSATRRYTDALSHDGVSYTYTLAITAPLGREPATLDEPDAAQDEDQFVLNGGFAADGQPVTVTLRVDIEVDAPTVVRSEGGSTTTYTFQGATFEYRNEHFCIFGECAGEDTRGTKSSGESVHFNYSAATTGGILMILPTVLWQQTIKNADGSEDTWTVSQPPYEGIPRFILRVSDK